MGSCVVRKREVGGQRLGSGNINMQFDREGGKEGTRKRVHGPLTHVQSMFASMYRKYRGRTNSGDSSTFSTFGTSEVCSKPHPTHIHRISHAHTKTTATTPREPCQCMSVHRCSRLAESVPTNAGLPGLPGLPSRRAWPSGLVPTNRPTYQRRGKYLCWRLNIIAVAVADAENGSLPASESIHTTPRHIGVPNHLLHSLRTSPSSHRTLPWKQLPANKTAYSLTHRTTTHRSHPSPHSRPPSHPQLMPTSFNGHHRSTKH